VGRGDAGGGGITRGEVYLKGEGGRGNRGKRGRGNIGDSVAGKGETGEGGKVGEGGEAGRVRQGKGRGGEGTIGEGGEAGKGMGKRERGVKLSREVTMLVHPTPLRDGLTHIATVATLPQFSSLRSGGGLF